MRWRKLLPSAVLRKVFRRVQIDKTPAFGEMLTTLFNNSSGDQKAGMVNHLLSSVSPDMLKQVLSGTGLAGLAGMLGRAIRN